MDSVTGISARKLWQKGSCHEVQTVLNARLKEEA